VRFCSDPNVLFAGPGADTLCTGDPIEEGAGDVTLNCTGTIDEDSANITCTGSDEVSPGCTVDYEMTIVSTRNGETFFIESTLNATYEPKLCDSVPNTCLVTKSHGTRVGPEPPECATPVQPGTWGQLKARYH
jgi:hypothetical protein